MRTRTFKMGILGLLSLLPLTGCRSENGLCREGSCETHAAPTASGGYVNGGGQVAAETPYGGQKTCPVSGVSLAGIANPLPVVVNGQTLYVCCQQCAAKVKANPDAYLAKVSAERAGQVAASSATSLPAASGPYGGQKTCPVTGEELDPAGGALPVTVRGQTIYVCCRGCAMKVKLHPDTYLAKTIAERAQNASAR
jgi:YHS domain-containing protein